MSLGEAPLVYQKPEGVVYIYVVILETRASLPIICKTEDMRVNAGMSYAWPQRS